ncbi:hypothetical protein OX284_007695 [Flavobacterium sp. SUN046]|uniref:hypothetical protein n=1 Tax=Flavobacterium sp. SUN046 TaxID=3002440 RepID=UPI002DBCF1BC|nr:hypothetical protein [Flavobacterium sp. SUN046]MEC4049310.1 hypothetical protein [Flavobacterium sp. SUN046]
MKKSKTEEKEVRMYTGTKVEVTDFIKKGRTAFVKTINEAIELTKRKSYYYEIFDDKQNLIGYGIPK